MASTTRLRVVQIEQDADTRARCVLDIVGFDAPSTPTPVNWTALARDQDRRELLLSLVAQIDLLAAGRIDEISISRD